MRRSFLVLLFFIPLFSFSQMASIELVARPVPVPAVLDTAVLNWTQSQAGFRSLNKDARDFYYFINLARLKPGQFWDSVLVPLFETFPNLRGRDAQSLANDLEKTGPLPMLALNPLLIRTAQGHATDIAGKHLAPSHTSSNGTDFGTRIKAAGIKYCASENISISSQATVLAVVLLYLDIGLPEKGHRKALLDGKLREMGVGVAPYGKDQTFFVQDLACAQ
jgi:hypothetical protein